MILNLHYKYYGLHDFGFLHVTDMATASETKSTHRKTVFFKGNKKKSLDDSFCKAGSGHKGKEQVCTPLEVAVD